ncbi:alpha-ketoglutarate-dependent dioxygenase AlkB family protein [Lysobacter niabensis]|uniref:alpha-ketoglutarate-dependent dioxygenase AlkB family protein n=1 Tax=Agrilutibacter niabensis TaxID=380628 RepID=UPI00360A2943
MSASVHQVELFDSRDPRVLVEDAGGGVVYQRGLIDATAARQWFEKLRDEVPWQAQRRPMYDRIVDVPRLTAGFRLDSERLPQSLREAAAVLARRTGQPFNAVGLNYYRDGRDSVAPHGDKLHMLVPGHPVALISLGAIRRMTIRPKQPPRTPIHVDLEAGSLLLMSYDSQLHYEHGVPKTREAVGPRISLAFRVRPDVDRLP